MHLGAFIKVMELLCVECVCVCVCVLLMLKFCYEKLIRRGNNKSSSSSPIHNDTGYYIEGLIVDGERACN